MPTSTKRFSRALVFASLLGGAMLLALPAAAQEAGDAALAAPQISSATNGCGTATSIGSANVAPVYVDGFPCASNTGGVAFNQPYTNLKICVPGSTTNCQIIDHVIVDSGSDGVRVAATALKSALLKALPAVTSGAKDLTECETYVDSFVYGPLKTVDLYIAGRSAKSVPVQVFGTGSATGFAVPKACSSQGGSETDTVSDFGGNGLIGVAFDLTDSGPYFSCKANSSNCSANGTYAGIPNVVSKFASDNNGAVMTLHTISSKGAAAAVSGSLIFGVGTKTNNTPPAGTTAIVNNSNGEFNLKVATTATSTAYIDSGTDDLVINDKNLTQCASSSAGDSYFCPKSNTSLALGISSYTTDTVAYSLSYTVANATTLFSSNSGDDVAFDDLAEPASADSALTGDYAMGLTTFFGRTMYFVFNGKSSSLGKGPINAIWPQ